MYACRQPELRFNITFLALFYLLTLGGRQVGLLYYPIVTTCHRILVVVLAKHKSLNYIIAKAL